METIRDEWIKCECGRDFQSRGGEAACSMCTAKKRTAELIEANQNAPVDLLIRTLFEQHGVSSMHDDDDGWLYTAGDVLELWYSVDYLRLNFRYVSPDGRLVRTFFEAVHQNSVTDPQPDDICDYGVSLTPIVDKVLDDWERAKSAGEVDAQAEGESPA